jgi:hypothetical protein
VDEVRISPAGDPFSAKPGLPHKPKKLAALEERYQHEDLDVEARLELRDRILRLRGRVARGGA